MKLLIIIVTTILLLCLRFTTYYQNVPSYVDGQGIHLQVVLQEEPQLSNQGQKFVVKTGENKRIYIQTNLSEHYHYGDTLAIEGQLQVQKSKKGS